MAGGGAVDAGPAVRLYRAEWSTNCERVGLALAHKGIAAQSVMIEYTNRAPVEAISGQGLVPVIEDAGRVVKDSVAIMRHLEERTPEPPLFPAEPARRAELDVFIEWFERVYKAPPNGIENELERDAPDLDRVEALGAVMGDRLGVFERLLDGREYLLGYFGAADCVAYPFLKYAAGRDPDDDELFHRILEQHQPLDKHPNLRAWIARMSERPRAY
jgi:glutathione S-transferase